MRFSILAGATLAATALTAVTAVPAVAQDTTTTFEVQTGDLAITAPASASLGAADPGDTISGNLGTTTVEDSRAAADGTWTATAALTDSFTTGAGGASETIPDSNVNYDPGEAIDPVNGPFVAGPGGTLDTSVTAFSRQEGSGNNQVSWNPTLAVDIPNTVVAGTYTGTVTHSVA